ncbi:hypothetical protein HYALB_00005903 [Hymenoscyphus albidus]|uniref:Protein kinase domain-containing protein n=1 Tax=Hymenoscyphus albidus TaxID=595503 RepID=A0A9N9Q8C1_9HELO|nr:hypothetical protein HYALB_00005903 [Hymenoscyphus albidus]
MVSPSKTMEKLLQREMKRYFDNGERDLNPFHIHRMILASQHENWRFYIRDLILGLKEQSDLVTLTQVRSQQERLSPPDDFVVKFIDRQKLKKIEDQVLDLITVFESSQNTLLRLQRQYKIHCVPERCLECICSMVIEEFEEQICEIRENLKKVEVLHQRVQGTAHLLSDILDYENSQALHGLVQESKDENNKMRLLTERSAQDAAAMKILTVITLIYLPISVVRWTFDMSEKFHLLEGLANGHKLRKLILGFQVESPRGSDDYFIPDNLINALEHDVIVAHLKKEHSDLARDNEKCHYYARKICASKKRLFILLVGFKLNVDWEKAKTILLHEAFHDKELPFCRGYIRGNSYVLCNRDHKGYVQKSHENCGLPLLQNWEAHDVQTLQRDQWSVQAPRFMSFHGEIPHLALPDRVIMPFIENNEKDEKEGGGYGEVWSVRIHPSHQNLIRSNNDQEPKLAIKRLFKDVDFNQENRILQALTTKHHPHLMGLLATYSLGNKYHSVFPYAKANLRQFWNSIDMSDLNGEFLLWVIDQIEGLASALAAIHIFEPKKTTSSARNQVATLNISNLRNPTLPSNFVDIPTDETFGRHGDIKPENILLVDESEGSGTEGILQIADFGLGRFHRIESRSLQNPVGMRGSATYSPPKLVTGILVSRAYDIWSLGCTFPEFVTWLCTGKDGLKSLSDKRMVKGAYGWDDDYYYTDNGGPRGVADSAPVRASVKDWIYGLPQNDRCSRCLSEILDIIENRMIVIDPKSRISAEGLKPNCIQF